MKKFYKCTPTATKHVLHADFTYVHEKVILLGRSRFRALVVLVFGHDMQIKVANALCKQGWRLIINTENKRLVTIEACFNIVPGLPYLPSYNMDESTHVPNVIRMLCVNVLDPYFSNRMIYRSVIDRCDIPSQVGRLFRLHCHVVFAQETPSSFEMFQH